jgi:hypothetical protein
MAASANEGASDLGNVRDGYPSFAAWIGRDPDSETLVFRRFRRLSARNLLHLQSQLIQLEYEIDALDEEARRSSDLDACQASRRWETLTQLATDSQRPEKVRLEKVAELSARMKEYGESHKPCCILELMLGGRRSTATTIPYRRTECAQQPGPFCVPRLY